MLVRKNVCRFYWTWVCGKNVHGFLHKMFESPNELTDPLSLEYTTARVIQQMSQMKLNIKFCFHMNLRNDTNSGF